MPLTDIVVAHSGSAMQTTHYILCVVTVALKARSCVQRAGAGSDDHRGYSAAIMADVANQDLHPFPVVPCARTQYACSLG